MKKILVISPENGELNTISGFLKDVVPGGPVVFTQSGTEGLKNAKAESPEIVLLDFGIKEMDRYEVCKKLKSDHITKHIPILMMTDTVSDAKSYIQGLEAGADGFFQKPIDKSELTAQMNMALRINRLEKEKAELKQQLQQAHKMEAIGTLAGGIAHEFNNILFPIIGYTEMCMFDVPENSKAHKNLSAVLKAADRAKELIQQIQNFSTKEECKRKNLKIQYVIKESLKLLRASLPSTIDIRQEIDKTCGPVSADPSEIQQIIMNLSANAYQVMEEKGGVMEFALSEMPLDSGDFLSEVGLSAGSYLKLAVIVKGAGLEHAEAKYIFDPYHRIRDDSEGGVTGLGIIYDIVHRYGGKVQVGSIANQGITVDIYLPVIDTPSVNISEMSAEAQMPFGHERLLLVDDEEDIIEMMHALFEELGYRVDSTTSSIDALDRFRKNPETYDMVISNLTMPQMTGMELIRRLRLFRPDIPVIVCTGFDEKIAKDQAAQLGIDALVIKPVRIAKIAGKIRDILDRDQNMDRK
ncbi:MAG: response regulator [Desulfobacterales bacterium]|jgi:CheY-like chemotaxis protein